MKKLILILSLTLVLCLSFAGCDTFPEEYADDYREELYYEEEAYVQPQQEVPAPEPSYFFLRDANAPLYDGVVKYAGNFMFFTVGYDLNAQPQPILVTSDNEEVVHITANSPEGHNRSFVRLEFHQAGIANLTIALESGESTTYEIIVKEDYDFRPEKTYLTTGEFESCVRQIMQANGMTLMSNTTMHHGSLYLEDYEMTWENARNFGENKSRQCYLEGYNSVYFTYQGTCPSGYKFTSYLPE